jgi:hypothetical protein
MEAAFVGIGPSPVPANFKPMIVESPEEISQGSNPALPPPPMPQAPPPPPASQPRTGGPTRRRLLQAAPGAASDTSGQQPRSSNGDGAGSPKKPSPLPPSPKPALSAEDLARIRILGPPIAATPQPNITAAEPAGLNATTEPFVANTSLEAPLLRPPVPTGNPVKPGDLPQDVAMATAVEAGGTGSEGMGPVPVPSPVQAAASGLIVASPEVRRDSSRVEKG